MGKRFLVCLSLFLNYSLAFADLNIKNWKQKNIINELGQKVEVFIELKAENLQANYYYDSWGYSFGKSSKVKIIKSEILNGHGKNTSFSNNVLEFEFNNLLNNKSVVLHFVYQLYNRKLEEVKYLRNEFVQIPSFASKAKASLEVQISDNYNVYSLNKLFNIKNENSMDVYSWNGIVPSDGITERFDLTMKKAKWEGITRISFVSSDIVNSAKMKVPLLYVGGNNSVIEYNIYTNQVNYFDNDKIKKDDKYIMASFDGFNSKEGFIEIRAIFENNYDNFQWLNNFNLNGMVHIEPEQEPTLTSIAQKIISENKEDLPSHVKIGQWVNKNIKYDIQYFGKKMKPVEILTTGYGVCEHYSILYENLLKAIGIPAISVSGVAYNEKNKTFENHAWTILHYNENWLPMDPTWGIFSGKLPISHIFLYNSLDEKYLVNTTRKVSNTNVKDTKISIDIENSVNFIEAE